MHLTLIVNPFASTANVRVRVQIERLLSERHEVTVVETTKSGHAIRLAHRAVADGTDVVLGLGGDGTINEIANGVMGMGATIAPLPGGSTNVLARAIGYPNDPLQAAAVFLEALQHPDTSRNRIRAGVGRAGDRIFLFHAGIGFDAAIVSRVERRGPLKRYAGHALFAAITADNWLRSMRRREPWFRIESDSGDVIDDAQLAVALNTDPYTFLGNQPLNLAPEARLDRPLSVVALSSMAPAPALKAGLTALSGKSGIATGRSTSHWSDVNRLTVRGHRPFPYQLDGESFDEVEELTIDYLPDVVTFIAPAGLEKPSS